MGEITNQTSTEKLVVLHIMHSWGGGLERWVQDYCRTDITRTNIVLKSLGIPGIPGQRIALYEHIDDEKPTRVWELSFPIRATSVNNQDYSYALEEIINDFNVSAIMISSLIGHSLDILNKGIGTTIICHDYYPFCPAINIYFEKICNECNFSHLQHCFVENQHNRFFPGISASEWVRVRENFINLILHYEISLVVPSSSVKQHLIQLEPAFKNVDFKLISHGIEQKVISNDNYAKRFKILILGRLSLHKGLNLFKQIYKEILDFADIVLLGCGEDGRLFEGVNGIQIAAENYSLPDLPEEIKKISPDIGLLLSIWPETFSYTLSELMLLNIPTLATKLGSFEERITDESNGFLVKPDKDSLIQKIKYLSQRPDLILQVAENLQKSSHLSLKDMVDSYHNIVIFKTSDKEKIPLETCLLQSTQEELKEMQLKMQQTQMELEQAKNMISAMETSKFWKMRVKWFKIKKMLGLKTQE